MCGWLPKVSGAPSAIGSVVAITAGLEQVMATHTSIGGTNQLEFADPAELAHLPVSKVGQARGAKSAHRVCCRSGPAPPRSHLSLNPPCK
jgi:hypothetical protein